VYILEKKPMINLATSGHVNHGKSTLLGHLLYKQGVISPKELERLQVKAKDLDKSSFLFAFAFDKSLEARERGLTIEVGYSSFETEKKKFNLIDCPGHVDFIENMIGGVVNADASLLVVSAKVGEFEEGVGVDSKGRLGQTNEHIQILKGFGIDQIIVAVNKMDDHSVQWSKSRYTHCKETLTQILEVSGFNLQKVQFIPVSALLGDNIKQYSEKMPWYQGPSLLDTLDLLDGPPRHINLPFRMSIFRVFRTPGGSVIAGRIESGEVKVGDSITIVPYPGKGSISATVQSIEWQHIRLEKGLPGYDVGILLQVPRGFVRRQIKRGCVAGASAKPPCPVKKFKAEIVTLDLPWHIRVGYTPILYCHQAITPCKIIKIVESFDLKTAKAKKTPPYVSKGEKALVWMQPLKPLIIEDSKKHPKMSLFILRDGNRTIARGSCVEVET
jgi:elongation factor 1-alpha